MEFRVWSSEFGVPGSEFGVLRRCPANGKRNEACGRAPRAMRERSPHCGTGVLARRFAFAGCEILEVCDGLRQKQRARAPVLHSIATANGER